MRRGQVNIATMRNHGDEHSRYDILVRPGDYSETSGIGPSFQFKDVNISFDLHLTGSNIPDSLRQGDKRHVIAQLDYYNSTKSLLFFDPVSTEVRWPNSTPSPVARGAVDGDEDARERPLVALASVWQQDACAVSGRAHRPVPRWPAGPRYGPRGSRADHAEPCRYVGRSRARGSARAGCG